MNKKTSIIFFGTPDFAVASLEALIKVEQYDIKAVITRSDKPAGRGKQIQSSPIKLKALEYKLDVLEPEVLDEEFFSKIKSLKPEIAVVIAYGKILPQELLDIPNHGFINVHPSSLPQYRGSSPMQSAILNNDDTTGVSIMLLDHKMDHGPILLQQKFELSNDITLPELHDNLATLGADLLIQAIDGYLDRSIRPQEQNHNAATFTKMIDKQSGRVDWAKSATEAYAQIRAYTGWPGAYTTYKDKKLEIVQASILEKNEKNKQPGLVVNIDRDIIVECGVGKIKLKKVKLSGKNEMSIEDFIRGHADFVGIILK